MVIYPRGPCDVERVGAVCGRAGTAEQGEDELVPGLDLWSETRRTPPYWKRDATPDLLPRAERHRTVMRAGVPIEYRSRRNPYPQAQIAIDNGGRIYRRRCAPC